MVRAVFFIAGFLRAFDVLADAAHPFAAPAPFAPATPGTAGGIGQVTVALVIVLLAIFAIGWLMRRVRGFSSRGGTGIEVVSEIGLGTRERAVVLKVGSARLLVGVAPGRVNLLHVLPADDPALTGPGGSPLPEKEPARPTFLSLLQKSLGR